MTEKAIAANLREQGFEVADKIVHLDEHIKEVGVHSVTLRFSADLQVSVSVTVVPEVDEDIEVEGT